MPPRRKPSSERNAAEDLQDVAETTTDGTQTDIVRAAIAVFNEDWGTLNLWEKIARITGMIGGVEKRGYNAFHKYHYVMEADLVSAVRQYLAAAGIVIIPDVVETIKDGELTQVTIDYIVTDGKENFHFRMPGHGADRGDKGVYKAITGSQKYALMKLFKIETGDDPEGDTRVDERAATRKDPERPVQVTGGDRTGVRRGAHTDNASPIQIRRISELVREAQIERTVLVGIIKGLFKDEVWLPEDEPGQQQAILNYIKSMKSEDAGILITNLAASVEPAEAPPVGY